MKDVLDQITKEAFEDELQKISAMVDAPTAGESISDSARVVGRQTAEGLGLAALGGGAGSGIGALIARLAKKDAKTGAVIGAASLAAPSLVAGMIHGNTKALEGAEKRFKEKYKKNINFSGPANYGSGMLGGLVASPLGPLAIGGQIGGSAIYLNAKKKEALGIK